MTRTLLMILPSAVLLLLTLYCAAVSLRRRSYLYGVLTFFLALLTTQKSVELIGFYTGEATPRSTAAEGFEAVVTVLAGLVAFQIVRVLQEKNEQSREHRLAETMFTNAQDGVFVVSADRGEYRFERANDVFVDMTGLAREKLLDTTADGPVRDEEKAALVRSQFDRCRREKEPVTYVHEPDSPELSRFWSTRLAPVVKNGSVKKIVGSTRDITEEKRRERRMAENEAILGQLTEATDDVFWLFDDGFENLLFINSAYEEIWGLKEEDLWENARDFLRGVHPEDRALIRTRMQEVSSGKDVDLVVRVNPREDFKHRVSISGRPVFGDDGSVVRIAGYSRDVTEQKEQERELTVLNERFEHIIEGARIGTWDWDIPGDEVVFNETLATMLQFRSEDLNPRPDLWTSLVHPEDETHLQQTLEALRSGEKSSIDLEIRLRTAEGNWKWIRLTGRVAERDDAGTPIRATGIHLDISDQKTLERRLQDRNRTLRDVVNTQEIISKTAQDSEAIFEVITHHLRDFTDSDGVAIELTDGDEMVCRAGNGLLEEEVGARLSVSDSLSGTCSRRGELVRCDDVSQSGRASSEQTDRLDIRSMVVLPLSFGGEPIGVLKAVSRAPREYDENDERVLNLMGGFLSSTISQARQFEKMETLAKTDALTGLNNRREILRQLRREYERSRRYGNELSLALLDVDNFKDVNDTHGHPIGDRVLEALADILRTETRGTDTIGRHGGEEFAVILTETGSDRAEVLVQRILETFRQRTFTVDDDSFRVTASAGIRSLEADVECMDDLIKHADQALYEAKRKGRNRYRVYGGVEQVQSSEVRRTGR